MTERDLYGTRETGGLTNAREYHEERHQQEGGIRRVDWTEPKLRVTRLRLISDPGFPFWDVSYCHGIITHDDGRKEHVDVDLPFSQLPKRRMMGALIHYAKRDRVYAKGLGVLDAISTLN